MDGGWIGMHQVRQGHEVGWEPQKVAVHRAKEQGGTLKGRLGEMGTEQKRAYSFTW